MICLYIIPLQQWVKINQKIYGRESSITWEVSFISNAADVPQQIFQKKSLITKDAKDINCDIPKEWGNGLANKIGMNF